MHKTKAEASQQNAPRGNASVLKRLVMRNTVLRMIFYRDILPGDIFEFNEFDDDERDPFKIDGPFKVRVKAVKNGYVAYEHVAGSMWKNESMKRSSFLFCYVPTFDA